MKKVCAVVMVLCLLFTGCSGVSQEEYDSLKADYDALKLEHGQKIADASAQIDFLQRELDIYSHQSEDKSNIDWYRENAGVIADFLVYDYNNVESGNINESISYICKNAKFNDEDILYLHLNVDKNEPISECAKLFVSCAIKADRDRNELYLENNFTKMICVINYGGVRLGAFCAEISERKQQGINLDLYIDFDVVLFVAEKSPEYSIKEEIAKLYDTMDQQVFYDIPFVANAKISAETGDGMNVESEQGPTETSNSTETTQPIEEQTEITLGMKNALGKAKLYLEVMAFSYSGLIEQLEYEGYSTFEATYGVGNCGADWNEQAVKKAETYLDVMNFSKSGLIEQLEYDGFTHEQAVYAAESVGY